MINTLRWGVGVVITLLMLILGAVGATNMKVGNLAVAMEPRIAIVEQTGGRNAEDIRMLNSEVRALERTTRKNGLTEP